MKQHDPNNLARPSFDEELARTFAGAMRATGTTPPSHADIASELERSRDVARRRPERNRNPASHAQRKALEAKRDAKGEPLGPELPTHERRGYGLTLDKQRKTPPRTSKGTPANKGPSRERRRTLAAIQQAAPRLRLKDWTDRIAKRARQIGRSAIEAQRALAELPRVLSIRARRAALGIERGAYSWRARRSFRSQYARRTIAYVWAIYRCALDTRRRGFSKLTTGVTQGMLAALIVNPVTLQPYSRAGVAATKSGSRGNDCGPLHALEEAGAWYAEQPPADLCPVDLVGPSGHAVQHYWIAERACSTLCEPHELEIEEVPPHDPPRRPFGSSAILGVHGPEGATATGPP